MPRPLYLNGKKVTVDPDKRVGEGRESEVYDLDGSNVLLLFKDERHPDNQGDLRKEEAARKRLEIMQAKLRAFPQMLPPFVAVPRDFVTDQTRTKILGYTMEYIKDSWPLTSFTEKSFRRAHGISNDTIMEIFRNLHVTVSKLHKRGIIIGDFQPDNILVNRMNQPYLIDMHSFQFGDHQCSMFKPSFADPLLCDSEARDIRMIRPHTRDSDWYAYTAMLMQSLVLCHPYDGVFRTLDRKKQVLHRLRPLHRITVFRPEVWYPEDAISYDILPDTLLQFFYAVFEQDTRGTFPSYLLDIRWKKCAECGTEHVRQRCPVCFPASIETKKVVTVHGNITAKHIFATRGHILIADMQEGQLQYLYYENGCYRREDGCIVKDRDYDPRHHLDRKDCVTDTAILRATDEGIVRINRANGKITRFPATKPFVNAESKLLLTAGGIYVVNEQSITFLTIN